MSNLRVNELESLATGRAISVDDIDTDVRKDLTNTDTGAAMVAGGVALSRSSLGELLEIDANVISSGQTANVDGRTLTWTAGDLSSEVASDTKREFYLPPDSDPSGASGSWVFYNHLSAKNSKDYATLGPNLLSPVSIASHSGGAVASVSSPVQIEPFKYYQLTIDIVTSLDGYIKFLIDGNLFILGDQPNGILFSNAPVLNNATENNREVSNNLYYFTFFTSGKSASNFSIETDENWAGSINGAELREISTKEFGLSVTSSDGLGRNNPIGIKAGAYNRCDVAVGDGATLCTMLYDGVSPTPAFNTAIGGKALASNFKGDENTAVGAMSLMCNEGSNNTAVGYSALAANTKGQENTSVGYKSGRSVTTGYRNTFIGFWAGTNVTTGTGNVDIGWRPNSAKGNANHTTATGYNAGIAVLNGGSNTFYGSNSGRTLSAQSTMDLTNVTALGAETKPWGDYSVTVGFQARVGEESSKTDRAIAIGSNSIVTGSRGSVALGSNSTVSGESSIAIGFTSKSDGTHTVSIGTEAQAIANQTVSLGAFSEANGEYSTSIGAQAGRDWTGRNNTFLGRVAGGRVAVNYDNCTLLGASSIATGSNQVQLGHTGSTTYAYGAVQDRSDARDKADIQPLSDAHIDFFMDVEWRLFRWDYRDDYTDFDDDGNPVEYEKDGSKKRTRLHVGAIAQQVEEAMLRHGVDFAGLQHHAIAGGRDVYSIGYSEFIGIQGEIIQRQHRKLEMIEERLDKAGL